MDNPANPDEIESLPTIANNAASKMIKLPTNSNLTANHLQIMKHRS